MHIYAVFSFYFMLKYEFLAKYVHYTILSVTFKMATISGYGTLNVAGCRTLRFFHLKCAFDLQIVKYCRFRQHNFKIFVDKLPFG